MKRVLSYIALAILGPIWRLPAWAQLTTLGVGGIAAAVTILTPPTVLPQPSAAFSQANSWGFVNMALKPNGGTAGPFAFPPTPTNSFTVYHDVTIDPNLGGLAKWILGNGSALGGEAVSSSNPGAPVFAVQDNVLGAGAHGFNWWTATTGVQVASSIGQISLASKGTNYNPAMLTWAATGGCPSPSSREPTGIVLAGGSNGTFKLAIRAGSAAARRQSTLAPFQGSACLRLPRQRSVRPIHLPAARSRSPLPFRSIMAFSQGSSSSLPDIRPRDGTELMLRFQGRPALGLLVRTRVLGHALARSRSTEQRPTPQEAERAAP